MAAGFIQLTIKAADGAEHQVTFWSSDGTPTGTLYPAHLPVKSDLSGLLDPATQTTLVAVLSKLSGDPATNTALAAFAAANHTDLAALATLIGTTNTDLGTVLHGDLASILAKITSDPATQTTLAAVLAKLSGDPATQTTLAAVLAKITSDPSTATNQTSANTKLDQLHTDLTTGATPAGANEIGRVNTRHINVAAATLTRPANTTAYSANDSISDNATPGSVTALAVTVSDTNDDPVDITEILLDTNDTGFSGAIVRCHVFNSDPTANSGVGAGDNAAWSQKKAGWVGSFTGMMTGFSDGCKGTLVSDGAPVRIANVESAGKRLWYQLQSLTAATPSANSTTFTPRFKGYQGRA